MQSFFQFSRGAAIAGALVLAAGMAQAASMYLAPKRWARVHRAVAPASR